MSRSEGPRSHRSIPVETDESLDMTQLGPQEHLWGLSPTPLELRGPRHHADVRPSREQLDEHWLLHHSVAAESLEPPNSLRSEHSLEQHDPGAAGPGGGYGPCQLPALAPHYNQQQHVYHQSRPQNRALHDHPLGSLQGHGVSRAVMSEVCPSLTRSASVHPGGVKKTISLPEECKNVFITYSVDTAKDMIPFTKFLIANGFQPAIDIFDNPLRSLDIIKWMDRFLNDKSVLIIVAISPQYKEDVEGLGTNEHGLHTKYIHNQIQNEFIQQSCLNFRLVPVLFPGASKNHVPKWLWNTKLYRWPQDDSDLLLRLYRMERYIVPPPATKVTLTVDKI